MAELSAEEQRELDSLRALKTAAAPTPVTGLSGAEQDELASLRALRGSRAAEPANIADRPRTLETVELTGRTPETTPATGVLGSLANFLTEQSFVPPVSAPSGELIRPQATQAETAALSDALRTGGRVGLEVGGAFALPAATGATKLASGFARGAPFARRALSSALVGGEAAFGALGGRRAGQALGLADEKPLEEDLELLQRDVAFGALTPIGIDAGLSILRKTAGGASKFLSSSPRLARLFGARNQELHDDAQKALIQNIADLQADDEFATRVVGAPTVEGSKDAAKDILNRLGKQIGQFEEANKGLFATTRDILDNSFYDELLDAATNPAVPKTDQAIARRVLNDFESTLPAGFLKGDKTISLDRLLRSRRAFDKKVEKGFYAKNAGDITPRFELYKTAADVYRDIINKTAPELTELNEKFSKLAPITSILKNASAKELGKLPILDSSIGFTDALRGVGLVGLSTFGGTPGIATAVGLTALGSNRGRAALFNLGRTETPDLVRRFGSQAGIGLGRALLGEEQ